MDSKVMAAQTHGEKATRPTSPLAIAFRPHTGYARGVNVRAIQEAVASMFAGDANVTTVYLFGSQARGTARPDSDIDLAILYRTAPPKTLLDRPFGTQEELSAQLGRRVQIVVMNSAPVDLIHRVLRDGQLLLETDRSSRIAFEVKARNQYFDLLPILERYRRRSA